MTFRISRETMPKLQTYTENSLYSKKFTLQQQEEVDSVTQTTNRFNDERVESKSVITEDSQRILNDYLECSSVHGVKYFGKIAIGVELFRKFIWTCTLLAGVVCSSLMVLQFWYRYNSNPTFTYTKSFFSPIAFVPFPAVTICPFQPNLKERRENIIKGLKIPENITKEEVNFLIKHSHELAEPEVAQRFAKFKDQLDKLLKENHWELNDLLQLSISCEDFFETCWWNDSRKKCGDLFRKAYTMNGICCSFNYILEQHMQGYSDVRPIQTGSYGLSSGLRVILNKELLLEDEDQDAMSRVLTNSNGVLVFIHHSTGYPSDGTNRRVMQANRELQISITPSLHSLPAGFQYTTFSGETVPLCVSKDENELLYFSDYRFSNCFTGCKIRLMIKICGCVAFNYYPLVQNRSIKICTLSDYACLKTNEENFRITQNIRKENYTCICRQPCKNILYDSMISGFALDHKKLPFSQIYQGITDGQAVLRVFMTSQFYTVFETIPATTEISLLASLGGVFGLFLGCSFLSALEILYFGILLYFTISPYFRRNRNPPVY